MPPGAQTALAGAVPYEETGNMRFSAKFAPLLALALASGCVAITDEDPGDAEEEEEEIAVAASADDAAPEPEPPALDPRCEPGAPGTLLQSLPFPVPGPAFYGGYYGGGYNSWVQPGADDPRCRSDGSSVLPPMSYLPGYYGGAGYPGMGGGMMTPGYYPGGYGLGGYGGYGGLGGYGGYGGYGGIPSYGGYGGYGGVGSYGGGGGAVFRGYDYSSGTPKPICCPTTAAAP